MIPIREDLDVYAPPPWVGPTVGRLLGSLPPEHLMGLSAIVLTEFAKAQKKKMRRRAGRRSHPNERLGFYAPAWRGEPPGIYLVVDNILGSKRPWLQFSRDFTIAEVLFHEIGHHLNAKAGLIAANEEASANAWGRKLWAVHYRKRYLGVRPLARRLLPVLSRLQQFARSRAKSARKRALA
jgi:hypothetical protein